MNRATLFQFAVVLSVSSCQFCTAQGNTVPLHAPTVTLSQRSSQITIPTETIGFTPLVYRHGMFISYLPATGAVYAWDRTGALRAQFAPKIPGAAEIFIHDVDVMPDGKFVLSGDASTSSGQGERYLIRTDSTGKLLNFLRTGTFTATRICAIDDGTIWTFGKEIPEQTADPNYKVLRNFDFSSGLRVSLIARKTFASKLSPAGSINEGTFLTCTNNVIGIYAGATHEWIQYKPKENLLGRWTVDTTSAPAHLHVDGLTYIGAGSGHIYATVSGESGRYRPSTLFELVFSKVDSHLHWTPVEGTASDSNSYAGTVLRIFGSDKGKVVALDARPDHMREVFWADPIFR